MNLSEKITLLKNLLIEILKGISALNSSNFDNLFGQIKKNIELVGKLKSELKNEFEIDMLRKYEGELVILSDQINNRFSNVIVDFTRQKQEVALQLIMNSNKRRLELYKR